MDAARDLRESLELLPKLQRGVAENGETLEEQAIWLEATVDEKISRINGGWNKGRRLDMLARLALLSELNAVIDFDRMIEAREKFQNLFPEHFKEYLKHLDYMARAVIWPGCFECLHYKHSQNKCLLHIIPIESSVGRTGIEKRCAQKELKKKAA